MVNDNMLTMLNIFICIAGFNLCMQRLSKMSKTTTKTVIRLQYTLWLGAFVASGLSSLFLTGWFPTELPQTILGAVILLYLLFGAGAWRYGQPYWAKPPENGVKE